MPVDQSLRFTFSDRLLDVLGSGQPRDTNYVLSSDGSLRPLDAKSRPEWLTTEDYWKVAWSQSASDGVRLKKMVRCKHEKLPKN